VTRHAYRFFAASVSGGVALLGPRDRRHLEQVLRMQMGDTCEVAAGGRAYRARVVPGGLELMEEIETVTAPPVTVWLAQPGGSFIDNSATVNINTGSSWHVQDPFVHDPFA